MTTAEQSGGGLSAPAARLATGAAIVAWAPAAILVVGAALPGLRGATLVVLLAGGALAVARSGRRSRLAAAWLATIPVAIVLAWGLVLAPAIAPIVAAAVEPDAAQQGARWCTDPASPGAVARIIESLAIIALVAALAALTGRASALRVAPATPRVTALAVAAPVVLVPLTLWVGPAIAAPFFGQLTLATGDLRALVPAALFGMANAALEELAYRGALLGWSQPSLGLRGALVAQAVVFGFAHMGLDVAPASAPFLWAGMALSGLIAGIVAVRTRSLLLCFAAHAAFDVPLYYGLACRIAG